MERWSLAAGMERRAQEMEAQEGQADEEATADIRKVRKPGEQLAHNACTLLMLLDAGSPEFLAQKSTWVARHNQYKEFKELFHAPLE